MAKVYSSGFKTDADAFVRNLDGTVSYNGDRGIHTVQVSENVNVSTAVDGESVFGRVQTAGGPKSVFEVVEGLMGSIDLFEKSTKWLQLKAVQELDLICQDKIKTGLLL